MRFVLRRKRDGVLFVKMIPGKYDLPEAETCPAAAFHRAQVFTARLGHDDEGNNVMLITEPPLPDDHTFNPEEWEPVAVITTLTLG